MSPLQLPANAAGEVLPFSTAEWFRTPSGRGELVPVPVFTAPRSRGRMRRRGCIRWSFCRGRRTTI